MLAFFCPCIVVGNIAEGVGQKKTLCCLGSLVPIVNLGIRIYLRNKLRDQKGIDVCMQISFILLVTECEPMHAVFQHKYIKIIQIRISSYQIMSHR